MLQHAPNGRVTPLSEKWPAVPVSVPKCLLSLLCFSMSPAKRSSTSLKSLCEIVSWGFLHAGKGISGHRGNWYMTDVAEYQDAP